MYVTTSGMSVLTLKEAFVPYTIGCRTPKGFAANVTYLFTITFFIMVATIFAGNS